MLIKVVMAGFHMSSATINPQRGVGEQTAFQEPQLSDRQLRGTTLLGALGAPPAAMFLLAKAMVSTSYFLGNRR